MKKRGIQRKQEGEQQKGRRRSVWSLKGKQLGGEGTGRKGAMAGSPIGGGGSRNVFNHKKWEACDAEERKRVKGDRPTLGNMRTGL